MSKFRWTILWIFLLIVFLFRLQDFLQVGAYEERRRPKPTPECTGTPEPSLTPTPTLIPSSTPVATPDPTSTPQITPDPSPTPIVTQPPNTPPTVVYSNPEPRISPVCQDQEPGPVVNIYVDTGIPDDGKLEVRWIPAQHAGKATIVYTDDKNPGAWEWSLVDTDNDGVQEIAGLQNGVHYWFSVWGVNGCRTGQPSSWYDPTP